MKKLFLICFLIMTAGPAFATTPKPEITVTDPAQATELAAVSAAVDAISGPVTKCVTEEKVNAVVCQCREKDKIEALKVLVAEKLAAHPEWSNVYIYYSTTGEQNPGTSINLDAITRNVTSVQCE
jgi:hypothetical protein